MGLPHADTIGRSGMLGLCTLGRPYKSGVHAGFGGVR